MHIVHFPETSPSSNPEIVASALGVFFDTNKHNADLSEEQVKIIDTFFDQLSFAANDPIPDEISFGQLMSVIDSENRWVYDGSLTTPPCSTIVHWNVVTKVYPISPEYVELFRRRNRGRGSGSMLGPNGNYRVTQKIDKHDLKLVSRVQKQESKVVESYDDEQPGLLEKRGGAPELDEILLILLLVTFFLIIGLTVFIWFNSKNQ